MKTIVVPSVKFDVGPEGPVSRCQSWKFQVSPGAVATAPVGWGIAARSIPRVIEPEPRDDMICPGPT